MFHKYNSFTNTLSSTDQVSAYVPQSFGTKETTNNYYVAPQPKGRQPGGSEKESLVGRQTSIFGFLTGKAGSSGSTLVDKAQTVAKTLSQSATAVSAAASKAAAAAAHGHGHHAHAAPWEGVNLWRTPYKGDTDTITHVKRNKGTLDEYVENRIRRIQQLQLLALRNKNIPTWVMMPRDKFIFVAQGAIAAYVLYQVTTTVYQHLKAKDRLKLLKLLYKDNVD
jgi:hypothetical protein